jgi:hypothetical protein
VLRGEKKAKQPKQWSKKQNQLRKMRDRDRERETKGLFQRGNSGVVVAFPGDDIRSY